MTKENARDELEIYLENHNQELPLDDCFVVSFSVGRFTTEWTFKELLCIAYDLKLDEDEKI